MKTLLLVKVPSTLFGSGYLIGALIAIGILGYLIYALIKPEKF